MFVVIMVDNGWYWLIIFAEIVNNARQHVPLGFSKEFSIRDTQLVYWICELLNPDLVYIFAKMLNSI